MAGWWVYCATLGYGTEVEAGLGGSGVFMPGNGVFEGIGGVCLYL